MLAFAFAEEIRITSENFFYFEMCACERYRFGVLSRKEAETIASHTEVHGPDTRWRWRGWGGIACKCLFIF